MALTGLVKELAGHCILQEHSNDTVHLLLAPSQQHLLQTTQQERLQEAIRTLFGKKVKLKISVEETVDESPSQQWAREKKERHETAVRAFEEDSNVQAIIETFDATLNKDSITSQ